MLVLSAGVGSGHNVAANVLENEFRRDPEVTVDRLDILETTNELYRRLYGETYFDLVDAAPWLVGWGYQRNDAPFRVGNVLSLWDRLNTTSAMKSIEKFRPDVVVSTHFLPARMASLMLTRGQLNARLAVVTTDYDFQGLWLSNPFHRFFVARDETKAHMADIGVPGDRITVSGIPVRPTLGDRVNRSDILRRYDLRPDQPTLLISAGAAGGNYTKAIVQQTKRMRHSFQAWVVCGRNAELKAEIESIVADRPEQYRVLGFTTEMDDLMRAASLFVGKPGGLSSSECMAAGLPMVLIRPIPGQETRNSDFLLEENAAVRCNYDTTVGYKIDQLIGNPELLGEMSANARRIGRPRAAAQIVAQMLADPPSPVWISSAAQKSMQYSSEEGVPTIDLDGARRTRTLVERSTGLTVAVMTEEQLVSLPNAIRAARDGLALSLTPDRISQLRAADVPPDVVVGLQRVLGDSAERVLEVPD